MQNEVESGTAGLSPQPSPAPRVSGAPTGRARPTGPERPPEIGGPGGPEPTRYGDWEVKGRCIDF
jgi:hypothetical protein